MHSFHFMLPPESRGGDGQVAVSVSASVSASVGLFFFFFLLLLLLFLLLNPKSMPELGRGCPSLLAEARLSLGLFVPPLIECNSGSKCRGFFLVWQLDRARLVLRGPTITSI